VRHRKIGNSDLEGSVVSLGTWVFGGDCWGKAEDDDSVRVVRDAVEKGMNFIDTAPIYGSGRSEQMIGRALAGVSRDSYIIATKCGLEISGSSIKPNLTKCFIRAEIENSLKRLGSGYIDLYQCHWPDPATPYEETFGELKKLVSEGKIRYIGVSNFSVDELSEARKYADIVSNQLQYSLFDRTVEKDMLPYCRENNISILSYGSLGGGILTGKYTKPPELAKGDVRSFFYRFYKEPFWGKGRQLVTVLEQIAADRKVPVSNVAINWVLSHLEAASCIAGCRNQEQLGKNITAGDWELSSEELGLIRNEYDRLFS